MYTSICTDFNQIRCRRELERDRPFTKQKQTAVYTCVDVGLFTEKQFHRRVNIYNHDERCERYGAVSAAVGCRRDIHVVIQMA